jgi:hypothetical protein
MKIRIKIKGKVELKMKKLNLQNLIKTMPQIWTVLTLLERII